MNAQQEKIDAVKKRIAKDVYSVNSFYYCWTKNIVTSTICRDSIQSGFHKIKRDGFFAFRATPKSSKQAIKLMKYAENRLNLDEESKIKNIKNTKYCLIFPSKFWFKNPLRFSFLTALIKKHELYECDIQDFIEEVPYFNNKEAFFKFLDGFCRSKYKIDNSLGYVNLISSHGSEALIK